MVTNVNISPTLATENVPQQINKRPSVGMIPALSQGHGTLRTTGSVGTSVSTNQSSVHFTRTLVPRCTTLVVRMGMDDVWTTARVRGTLSVVTGASGAEPTPGTTTYLVGTSVSTGD